MWQSSGGPPGYLETLSWADWDVERSIYQKMNVYIQKAMAQQSERLRLLDVYTLATNMPKEVIGGHGSIMLNLWTWTVLFNGMCAGGSGRHFASFQGKMCTGREARSRCVSGPFRPV